jgi:hypothetical protein
VRQVLELGRAGAAGGARGVRPVLRGDLVVATLRASNWKEAATAVVENREWVLAKAKGELTGRWAADPAGTARLRARQTSWWRGTWDVDLEGLVLQGARASVWRSALRYTEGDRQVAVGGTTGGWSPRPTLRADVPLPLHQQVFLLWVELVLARRDATVVGGTDGGGDGGGGGD